MTRKTDAIHLVDRYLRAGESVCPYARKAKIHYALDNEALGPTLMAIERSEACVVIASEAPDGFPDVKTWAQDTVLSMFVVLASLSNPTWSRQHARDHVRTHTEPVLRNDAHPCRLYLPVKGKPVLPVCMAPVYPVTHPRFSPMAIIVLTLLEDIDGVEIPAVREVMRREHGYVYDAQELVLPLPRAVPAITPPRSSRELETTQDSTTRPSTISKEANS